MIDTLNNSGFAEVPLVLSRLRCEYVAGKSMSPLYLTSAGLFKTLGSTPVCLDLWHF